MLNFFEGNDWSHDSFLQVVKVALWVMTRVMTLHIVTA